MRKRLTLVILVLFSWSMHGQLFTKERIKNQENFDMQFLSWGYFLGVNSYDFNFDYERDRPDILVDKTLGFSVGLIGNMRINNHLDLRLEPGLFITKRILNYDPSYFGGTSFTEADLQREVRSTYVHVPLLLKFSTKRINNIKPFIVGGFSTAINLSSNEENPEDNSNGQFRTKRNMLFYELGFGVDLYMFWFKFTPSIRGVFGINDELIRDEDPNSPWTSNITSMKTRGLFINFTFQ